MSNADPTADPAVSEMEAAALDYAREQGWTAPERPAPPVDPPKDPPPVDPPKDPPVINPVDPTPTLMPPAPPTGLTATPVWEPMCMECGNRPTSSVVLAWDALPGLTYSVYQDDAVAKAFDGTPAAGLTEATYAAMPLAQAQTYSFAVTATGPGGEGEKSSPVSAVAPSAPAAPVLPPATAALLPPANLSDAPSWDGGERNTLSWHPATGAVSYNLYSYDRLVQGGITTNGFALTDAMSAGGTLLTVTSVDPMGMESLRSAGLTPTPALAPGSDVPDYWSFAPQTPGGLKAVPEWNNGVPRVALSWAGGNGLYSVYRDGVRVAVGLWGLKFIDDAVEAGKDYSYTVSSVNTFTETESNQSPAVTVTALSGAPAASVDKLGILGVQPNDDSVKVSFNTVPGAVDYRLYNPANPSSFKYAGRNEAYQNSDMVKNSVTPVPELGVLSIEMNGLDPAVPTRLVLEAVDKLGPFQKMDGAAGASAMAMSGTAQSINGQGDPSNAPIVVASSEPFDVSFRPFALGGSQVFLDNFRDSRPLTPVSPLEPHLQAINDQGHVIREQENDRWVVRTYEADNDSTRAFFMGNHFMDALYDGPFAQHNNNASLVMLPKATADISGGKVLHVTFEVDAHFNGRRWCDLVLFQAGDTLLTATSPGKLGRDGTPSLKGNVLTWEIDGAGHSIGLMTPRADGQTGNDYADLLNRAWDDISPQRDEYFKHYTGESYANGSACQLDNRSRFDLYVSESRYRFVETEADGVTQIVKEKDFPSGVRLPFTKIQAGFVHEVYHTGNDRPECIGGAYNDCYWYNYTPWRDERHWDNMGFEVLDAFPEASS